MFCNRCGEELKDNSVFCSLCGSRQQVPGKTERNAAREGKYDIYYYEPLWNCWHIKELIGAGSYGKVYMAYREEYGQTYYAAVKHIAIPQDDVQLSDLYTEGLAEDEASAQEYYNEVLRNILKEVKTNYELKGQPNIVLYEEHVVFERPKTGGYDVFIKMELLTSLNKLLKNQSLSEQETAKLGIDICTALEILNRKKILHRDIKPANIFVTDDGVYKLGDFGIARHMDKTVSSMSLKGTYAYMSPEVQRGDKVDNRADIYSLGLVLYRVLNANRAPFLPLPPARISYADNNLALERRMSGEPLPLPRDAGAEMSSIILMACSYHKEDRWQDAAALKLKLCAFLQNSKSAAHNTKADIAGGSYNQLAGTAKQQQIEKDADKASSVSLEKTLLEETDFLTQTIGLYEDNSNEEKHDKVFKNSPRSNQAPVDYEMTNISQDNPCPKNDNTNKSFIIKRIALPTLFTFFAVLMVIVVAALFDWVELGINKDVLPNLLLLFGILTVYLALVFIKYGSDFYVTRETAAQYAQYIDVSANHAIVVQEDNSVQAAGINTNGQCNIDKWQDVIAVSAGDYHTVGLRKYGIVEAVGKNNCGQLNIKEWDHIVAIAAGGFHTVGLKSDGTAVAVGSDDFGECKLAAWKNLVAIAAGYKNTLGLVADGRVLSIGYRSF